MPDLVAPTVAVRPGNDVSANAALSRSFASIDVKAPGASPGIGLEHAILVAPPLIAPAVALRPGNDVAPFSILPAAIVHIDVEAPGMRRTELQQKDECGHDANDSVP
jgi:hypothetical protein